ncbi:glutamine synthetase family protein [Phytobacter palmae]|uniref:Glutamine synthetase family protein n=1 Tax=Phytobacter palmae TaxID=1855371 RepID=A0ABU9V445_9ENTR
MNSLMNFTSLKNMRALFPFTASSSAVVALMDISKKRIESDFAKEVHHYLARYPDTRHVDIYLTDTSGIFRGKRIAVAALNTLARGCYFPQSVYTMDKKGKVISRCENDNAEDEPDNLCVPVPGTLRPSAQDPRHHAQLLLMMRNDEGDGFEYDPRYILEKVLAKFHYHGLYPVIAPEIEFYLIDPQQQHQQEQQEAGCFHLSLSAAKTAFVEELETMAAAQNLPLSGVVCEAEPGQFELNLHHSSDVVALCENVLALRKLTCAVAEKQGLQANFMAKPFSALAGNGLHFHISLNNIHGENIFAADEGELNEMTRLCLAGLLRLMPASLAIMAPGVNGFRRLRKRIDTPIFNAWGFNKRSAALRIPCSDKADRRIEYRLAGADANPYLAMATILTGMLYGLEQVSDADLPDILTTAPVLPLFQQDALTVFGECDYLKAALGAEFSRYWIHSRLMELSAFEGIVTAEETHYPG